MARLAAGLLALAAVLPAASVRAAPASSTIELRVSRRGFEPSRLSLRRGESVRFVVSSADDEHCFAIDALRVEKRVRAGRATRFELTPERSGVFPYYCCLESGEAAKVERGQLTVSD